MIMFQHTTVILPSAGSHWEVWRCGRAPVWQGQAEDPATAANGGGVVMALPARACRTFAFSAPTEDKQLVRKLAFAQLEKRGLTQSGGEPVPFDCRVLEQGGGRSVVSVDVLMPGASATLSAAKAAAAAPSARLFPIPQDKLVVMEEQGRLVLCAGSGGRLLHSQIVSATRDLNGHAAPEIRIAALALQQQGVLHDVRGVELWGDFSTEEAKELSRQLELPVEATARPAPDCALVRREGGTQLLPAASRQQMRRRRLGWMKWAALALLPLAPAWWIYEKHRELTKVEAEAARMESTLDVPADTAADAEVRAGHALVTAAQARWTALRTALEPRRYPVAHLEGLTRCLAAADVVLTRFESKVSEVSVSGTARSAMDAYNYLNAVNADKPLGVYAWSMAQPALANDGTANFELKGKMR
jgi:hypothetical protein